MTTETQYLPQEQNQQFHAPSIVSSAISLNEMNQQIQLVQHLMRDHMKDGEHFGKIPGCGEKPSLLKAGAEKLSFMFRLAPSLSVETIEHDKGHREYRVLARIHHAPSGMLLGEGVGSCSSLEGKYRYRNAEKKCPSCGKETIIKGKAEFGGGWLCWGKKGGCNAKFADGDKSIEEQVSGKIEHDNPADYYNTVLKMAKKRAVVDGILTVTAASDIFTQDIEEMPEIFGENSQPAAKQEQAASAPKPAQKAPMAQGGTRPVVQEVPAVIAWEDTDGNPWAHILEGNGDGKLTMVSKPLFELPRAWFEKAIKPAHAGKLSGKDRSAIVAALEAPELKIAAIEAIAAREGTSLEDDEIPDFFEHEGPIHAAEADNH